MQVEGPLPAPGTAIQLADEEVGELRSGLGDRAIAMLRLDAVRSGGALTAAGVRVIPVIPLWMRLA